MSEEEKKETTVEDTELETKDEEEIENEEEETEEEEEEIELEPEERETIKKDDDSEDDDEDQDPEEKARIKKIVDREVGSKVRDMEIKQEVNSYIRSNPEFAKYEATIIKFAQHEAYSKIPIKNIAAIVTANKMQKIGAEKERQAQKKVASTKDPGSTVRKEENTVKDWSKASKEELEAKKNEIFGRV